MKSLLVLVLSVLLMCELNAQKSYNALPKYAATSLKEDAAILKKVLEANHPSLYWYTPKQQLDSAFDNMFNSISDSLNEIEFRNKVAPWVAMIKCGHTTALYSKKFIKELPPYRYPRFPLQIKFWEDSAVVLSNGYFKDSIIQRGTIVQTINNKPVAYYRDYLFKQITTDGYAINHQYQTLSSSFSDSYKQVFGVDSTYLIGYINQAGKADVISLGNFVPLKKCRS